MTLVLVFDSQIVVIVKGKGSLFVYRLLWANLSLLISRRGAQGEGSHSFTCHPHVEWTIPVFNPQPSRVAALWLYGTHFPVPLRVGGWVGLVRWFARLKPVTYPSICPGGWELNLRLHGRNAITTRPPSHVDTQVLLLVTQVLVSIIDVKKTFLRFLFLSRFYVFNVFFIFRRFLNKKRWKFAFDTS